MGLSPKKHLGQHFLEDLNHAANIVNQVPLTPSLAVVEIGPGEGVLTDMLVQKFGNITAVEVDDDAVNLLSDRYAPEELTIIHSDVLRWNMPKTLHGPTHIVGNLPYNISSPIFFMLLENRGLVASGTFMLQKEVAERICSGPGSKKYGILSVLLGVYFDCEYQFTVPPEAFRPPPKVHSGVITLTPIENPPEIDFPAFKTLVKKAFNQRRKTLKNALKGHEGVELSAEDPRWRLRAEQLSIADFVEMAGGENGAGILKEG